MNFRKVLKLLKIANEKEIDKRLWEQWLVEWPNMTKENFEDFKTYKDKRITLSKLSNRTKEEKKIDLQKTRDIAKEAMRRLNPKNDLHIMTKVKKR
jgi:hypothetical protein